MLAANTTVAGTPIDRALLQEVPVSWSEILRPIESFLPLLAEKILEQVSSFEMDLVDYASYALASQGKQIRPTLVALSGGAIGTVSEDHITVAAIVEIVHLATLVHDDVMDGARIRRRRPTLAANWGPSVSVLVGDCLFSHALEMAAGFPNPQVCRAIARSAKRVCSGEILQNQGRKNISLNRSQYLRVIEMKTAELFALSCEMGAIFCHSTPTQLAQLRSFGMSLGTAYQIYDDCLDLFGSEAIAGKSLGTDLNKGKLTLPVIVALERCGQNDRATIETMLLDWDQSMLPRLQASLEEFDCLEESRRTAREILNNAKGSLSDFRTSPHLEALHAMVRYVDHQFESLGSGAES